MPYADLTKRREYQKEYSRRWRRANREKVRGYKKKWQLENPEIFKAGQKRRSARRFLLCGDLIRAQAKKRYYGNIESNRKSRCISKHRHPETQRRWYHNLPQEMRLNKRLELRYKLTPEQYEGLLAQQGNVCAICETFVPNKSHPRLSIDHNHKTEKVRGLLCGNCNRGLGCFKDDLGKLQRAIAYLQKPLLQ